MLVLSRGPGQSIQIGDDIRIIVTSIQGDKVRLGFECPKDLTILRGELTRRSEYSEDGGAEPGGGRCYLRR